MKLLSIILIFITNNLFAYSASCNTNDGKNFNIIVQNKVMTINNKYRAFYQGKSILGWYEHSNKGYTYLTGEFEGNHFPIEVTNKWGLDTDGMCYFDN